VYDFHNKYIDLSSCPFILSNTSPTTVPEYRCHFI